MDIRYMKNIDVKIFLKGIKIILMIIYEITR